MAKTWKQHIANVKTEAEAAGKVVVVPGPQYVQDMLDKSHLPDITNEERLIRAAQAQTRKTKNLAADRARYPQTGEEMVAYRKKLLLARRKRRENSA